MKKIIWLFVVSGLIYIPTVLSQNNWGATASYGIGELKGNDSKTMAYVNSWGLSYEIGFKSKYGLSFELRRGAIRTSQMLSENSVFVTDRFAEAVLAGRRYYPIGDLCIIYGGVQLNSRWMYDREVESPALDTHSRNIGSTYGAGAFAGIRTVVSPKVTLDITLLENYDFAKSFKNSEEKFRINQVSLNVGLQIRL